MEGKCPRVGGESAQVSRITNHDSGPAQVRQTHGLCVLASASSLLAEGLAYCKFQTKKAGFFWSSSGDPLLASTQELQDVGPMTAVVIRVPHEGNGRILQIRSLFDQLP